MVIGTVCFRSGVTVSVGPTDASDGGIRAAKNFLAGGN
jgi:hypothetical protein